MRHYKTAKEHTGLRVCKNGCLDKRHPQEFVRGRPDDQRVADPRPEPADDFLAVNEITAEDL